MTAQASVNKRITTSDIVFCGLFVALMAVGAFIKIMIPLGVFQVTFSLQFFFALLAGFLLGGRLGFLSVLAYLLLGLCGMPIFAHGGGFAYVMKPTFGFLIGFAAAAFVSGAITKTMKKTTYPRLLFAAFIGEMAYYLCGLVYYFIMFNYVLTNGATIGFRELITVWFLSTVVPDFILCVLAALVAQRMIPVIRNLRGQHA
ncbi:MAG: biotin transporter BioY [Eubacterium sp.]|nr:biotin transporter BioY [Eubacterium sp.]